ncbi:DNA topoisomerase 2-binding protein 1 isoform X1 [Dendrobium catenatum]|uniref:DNA topoisomerase 2-binding protein 1 isoform X1 n=1 Tax=Dendrobium catenatum TaxID=906689 RepID=UPI0009F59F2B|nr:DNA topoisomerase 2-binding protein 1 isoform X1 [Dendrobium catenatum]XP_020679582.1 DNA topoisomerase 2-binding protein 1 isoform X1 [Dendrobium catenatum]XP_028549857.1 DNA topoisomerase 2-binding protein 1 isoform X1 [Dendrobium catenatum]XP_028549858.1 DNA topoisomerase 2-binding protein 1 isoform X1 [Dendrobium catenatum]
MSARSGTFSGTNVFLSRNLVPPEVFDAIHDALRLNGAQVFLCCDASRTAPNDYHVISSPDHEKFEDLKAKGCNLVGPQCIFSCAKEYRMLPKHGYTCCLAMDGVKVLASGFERDEKAMIEKLVTAMGGVLQAKAAMDVNFVIVKNVLAAKYKWALHVLKKPIVNMSWLCQCWIEHRVVPQEPYRILPFMGLTICVTRIPADERKEIERLIIQNGGQYSADLTKKCSHLVSDAPAGDKYVVAQRWGHIHIVSRKWIDQSISRRACLDERLYPVLEISLSGNDAKVLHKEQYFQEPSNVTSQLLPPTNIEDLEAASSQNISISETSTIKSEVAVAEAYPGKMEDKNVETNSEHVEDKVKFDCRVAQDSEEDDDLYLSSCRIFLAGFEEKELRKLVNMIRRGGGTRHMLLSEKLSHIILGTPSESEKKEIRRLAVSGVINVVNATWLEESDQAKRELPVSSRHIFSALMISKDSTYSCMEPSVVDQGVKKVENIRVFSFATTSPVTEDKVLVSKPLSNEKQGTNESCPIVNGFTEVVTKCEASRQHSIMKVNQTHESKLHMVSARGDSSNSKAVFKGKSFCFSSSFPVEPRAEVIEWVKGGGGGTLLDDQATNADFIIESHGLSQSLCASIFQSTSVSTHWIRASIEECCMQDVASHILYSPLNCHIPLPGFEDLRFCVSQYEGKERILLRNLCFVLGAKFTEKLTKKVTHLLCKFTNGPKYTAACRKGIQTVTAEWITECVSQDKLVPPDLFQPRPVTSQDKEAGLCTVSQHPTQAVRMISFPSQSPSQPQGLMQNSRMNVGSSSDGKRLNLSELDRNTRASKRKKVKEILGENRKTGPDVAEAIEDLLAQSDKIQDLKSPGTSGNGSNLQIFAPDPPIIDQNHGNSNTASGISNNWIIREQKQGSISHPTNQARKSGAYDAFTETQTESQVVGYEEDLSGRQKIIERVRSQSLTLTPDVR